MWDLDRHFATGGFGGQPFLPLRKILGILRDSYCRTTGIEYMQWLAEWYTKTAKTLRNGEGSIGFFQVAGGISGDFPICVVPMLHQDLQRTGVPLWGYFAACIASPVAWFFACFFLIPAYFAVRKRLTKELAAARVED